MADLLDLVSKPVLELGLAGVVVIVCLWTLRAFMKKYDAVQEARIADAKEREEREHRERLAGIKRPPDIDPPGSSS